MTMSYRAGAIVFFGLLGIFELVDFAGNVSTLADAGRVREAAEFLGVSEAGQRIRLTFLLPLTALIAGLSISVAIGAVFKDYRQSRRLLVTGLLLFYTVFEVLTAVVFEASVVAFAALFGALCVIAWWFARLAPDESGVSGEGVL